MFFLSVYLAAEQWGKNKIYIKEGSNLEEHTVDTSAFAQLTGATFTGDITVNAQKDVRFADSDSSNYIARVIGDRYPLYNDTLDILSDPLCPFIIYLGNSSNFFFGASDSQSINHQGSSGFMSLFLLIMIIIFNTISYIT